MSRDIIRVHPPGLISGLLGLMSWQGDFTMRYEYAWTMNGLAWPQPVIPSFHIKVALNKYISALNLLELCDLKFNLSLL